MRIATPVAERRVMSRKLVLPVSIEILKFSVFDRLVLEVRSIGELFAQRKNPQRPTAVRTA